MVAAVLAPKHRAWGRAAIDRTGISRMEGERPDDPFGAGEIQAFPGVATILTAVRAVLCAGENDFRALRMHRDGPHLGRLWQAACEGFPVRVIDGLAEESAGFGAGIDVDGRTIEGHDFSPPDE